MQVVANLRPWLMRNKGFAGVALSRACVCFEEYCCAVKERNFVKHLNFVRRKEKGDTQESNLHSFMDEIRLPSTLSTSSTSITNQIFCLLSIDPSLGFLHWRCCYYDSSDPCPWVGANKPDLFRAITFKRIIQMT